MQYIGDAKYGALQGTDQSVLPWLPVYPLLTVSTPVRFGNRYFENLDPVDEVPGQQMEHFSLSAPVLMNPPILCRPPPMGRLRPGRETWLHTRGPMWLTQYIWLFTQHDYHASQVPPEWHAWLSHIRKEPPTEDPVVQNLSPAWKSVCSIFQSILGHQSHRDLIRIALGRELDRYERSIQDLQYCRAKDDSLGTESYKPSWCLSIDVKFATCNHSRLLRHRSSISSFVCR